MTRADADRVPENAITVPPPNATRYSPVRTSPSAIVIVTGPRPIPVRANETLRGPISWAAVFMGNVSAVSVHPANATVTANSSISHDDWTMREIGLVMSVPACRSIGTFVSARGISFPAFVRMVCLTRPSDRYSSSCIIHMHRVHSATHKNAAPRVPVRRPTGERPEVALLLVCGCRSALIDDARLLRKVGGSLASGRPLIATLPMASLETQAPTFVVGYAGVETC